MRTIAQALPDRVLVCVDGVHGFGAKAATVRDLACDAFVSGCHKWLYGPRGTGVCGRTSARGADATDDPVLRRLQLRRLGRRRRAERHPGRADAHAGGFHSFEHRWALPEAFALHQGIGRERVEARIRGLASRLKARLAEMRCPTADAAVARLSAGLVCFEVAGRDPAEVVASRVATHRRERHAVRAALRPARAGDREHARARGRGRRAIASQRAGRAGAPIARRSDGR